MSLLKLRKKGAVPLKTQENLVELAQKTKMFQEVEGMVAVGSKRKLCSIPIKNAKM
jgi:hypothetical protein